MNQRNPAILKSARGQVCTLALPGICRSRTDTVVWCHSPYIEDGKGTGIKAHDALGAYGCVDCHDALDGRRKTDISRDEMRDYFHRALKKSLILMWRNGVKPW